MNYLALSGNMHSLRRYFNDRVTCLDAPTWGRASWSRRHAMKIAESIQEPTVLIGFSAGATAAIEIGCLSAWVGQVYAHSPMDRYRWWPSPEVFLFVTNGDTTPTREATERLYARWTDPKEMPDWVGDEVHIKRLDPIAPEPIRDLATWTMARKGHQFRNCLPFLPREILR